MTVKVRALAVATTVFALAGCAQPVSSPHGQVASSLPGAAASTGHPQPSHDAGRARADAVTAIARKLLDEVEVPPGSTGLQRPWTGPLSGPMQWSASDNLIDVSQLWRTPGSVDSVLSYIRGHLPSAFASSGEGHSNTVTWLMYPASAGGVLDQGALLLVAATSDGAGRVDVRADVEDIWRPVRTTAETVPTSVAGTTIVRKTHQFVSPPAPTTTKLDVGGATARQIARMLNALPTEAGFVSAGPGPSTVMTLTFAAGSNSLVFTTNDVLSTVSVVENGVAQPLLGDAAPVLAYLDALFGAGASAPG